MINTPEVAVRRVALGRLIANTGPDAAGTALDLAICRRTGWTGHDRVG